MLAAYDPLPVRITRGETSRGMTTLDGGVIRSLGLQSPMCWQLAHSFGSCDLPSSEEPQSPTGNCVVVVLLIWEPPFLEEGDSSCYSLYSHAFPRLF